MTLQNRVTPRGEIVGDPGRGLLMGNRGILHDLKRRVGRARWRHPHWVICVLEPRGVPRVLMSPGHYTELFFLDEAVALAAGHRPCARCRPSAYRQFAAAWAAGVAGGTAVPAHDMDKALHTARLNPDGSGSRLWRRAWRDLPDGTFVRHNGAAWLVDGVRLKRWTMAGYDEGITRPINGAAEVLTPEPTVMALLAGYRPLLHPSAAAC